MRVGGPIALPSLRLGIDPFLPTISQHSLFLLGTWAPYFFEQKVEALFTSVGEFETEATEGGGSLPEHPRGADAHSLHLPVSSRL